MGRSVITGLQPLLDLPSCETQTTLSIYPVVAAPVHVATRPLTANAINYIGDLRYCRELKQSVFATPDRVTAVIQNVDKNHGISARAENLTKATAIVGRYFSDSRGILDAKWVEMFRGESCPLKINESELEIEILSDLTAAGYCIADTTLADNCQWRFMGIECGYHGGETECNKKRVSTGGCLGRENEHRFGGMEFPVPQISTPPPPVLPDPPGPWPGGPGGPGGPGILVILPLQQ